MDLNGVTTTANAGLAGSGEPSQTGKLGKNEFLKLLLAQLSHQDPTSPADSQAFVAQLAQFANVEQLQGVNTQLETLLLAQTANNQAQTVGMLGKQVQFRSDSVQLGAEGATLHGELAKGPATVTAVIVDSTGKEVRRIELKDVPTGPLDVSWDGRDANGSAVPQGKYTVRLSAADAEGKNVPIEARGTGVVSQVSFANGYPEPKVGGVTLTLRDIVSVSQP